MIEYVLSCGTIESVCSEAVEKKSFANYGQVRPLGAVYMILLGKYILPELFGRLARKRQIQNQEHVDQDHSSPDVHLLVVGLLAGEFGRRESLNLVDVPVEDSVHEREVGSAEVDYFEVYFVFVELFDNDVV